MSGLDFLVLVLQRSNNFHLNAFFQVLFRLYLNVYKVHIQLLYLGAVCSTGLFDQAKSFFFHRKSSFCFPLKSHVFGMSFIFSGLTPLTPLFSRLNAAIFPVQRR